MKNNPYHILNGDCLKEQFPKEISGELIVARECLVVGDVSGETLDEFWQNRAAYMSNKYDEKKSAYYLKAVTEFEKIENIPDGSEVNLWFEEDLFCQVNLWFCVFLLQSKLDTCIINLVQPFNVNWRGFGALSTAELVRSYTIRKKLMPPSISLLSDCWQAFKNHDLEKLKKLSFRDLDQFPMLPEVVQAHADRFGKDGEMGRPAQVLLKLIRENKTTNFGKIFHLFSQKEGIYGFGDLQVKSIYEDVLNKM